MLCREVGNGCPFFGVQRQILDASIWNEIPGRAASTSTCLK